MALLFPACHDVGRVAGPLLTALGVALAPHGCLGGVRGWAARARHGMARGLFELLTLTPPAKPYTETRVFGGFGLADDRNACWSLQPDHEFKLIRALALAACESVPQLAFQFAILMASGASNCPAPGRGGCGPADGGAYSLAAGGVSAWLYFASIAANAMQAVHAWIELTRHARGLPGVGTNAYAAYLLGLRRGGGNKHVTCDLDRTVRSQVLIAASILFTCCCAVFLPPRLAAAFAHQLERGAYAGAALNLTGAGVGDMGAIVLAAALLDRRARNLRELVLARNNLSRAGVAARMDGTDGLYAKWVLGVWAR